MRAATATTAGPAKASAGIAHRNHYVPVWYQRRFLADGETHFHYLDLAPETVISPGGKKYQRRALLHWGPKRCFYRDDLYTMKLGAWSTDAIERQFFGRIDARGEKAVEFFSDYGLRDGVHEAFEAIIPYMDAQRFRTPCGIDRLKKMTDIRNQNLALFVLRQVFQYHTTMWTEGVWEVVNARERPTKFLLTDEPVTFYNAGAFPASKDCLYPNDVGLEEVGTRTIFPLSREQCLIITHRQLTRDPRTSPRRKRVNARAYQQTLASLAEIQYGRELEEDEVLRINLILKRRATRYIAAAKEEWLYPEKRASTTHWSSLDEDWFLFPNLYKVPFGRRIVIGYEDGRAWSMDEYGRRPGHPEFEDRKRRDREWVRHLEARTAWGVRRAGRSVARTGSEWNDAEDRIMKQDIDRYYQERADRRRARAARSARQNG